MAIDAVEEIDSCAVACDSAVAAICVIEKIVAVAAILSYINYMPLESTSSSCIARKRFSRKCCSNRRVEQQKAEIAFARIKRENALRSSRILES